VHHKLETSSAEELEGFILRCPERSQRLDGLLGTLAISRRTAEITSSRRVRSLYPATSLGHPAVCMVATIGKLQLATEAIAAAAIDSSLWVSALEAVSDAAGGCGAMLIPVRGELPELAHTPSLEAGVDGYINGWVSRDERKRGVPIMERTGVVTELDFITPDEIARKCVLSGLSRPPAAALVCGREGRL
jgi:hypothetical protein